MRQGIHEDALRVLIEQAAPREFLARRGPGGEGWSFCVRFGAHWLPIRSRREPVRVWASLTAVERFAQGLGVQRFLVEL